MLVCIPLLELALGGNFIPPDRFKDLRNHLNETSRMISGLNKRTP